MNCRKMVGFQNFLAGLLVLAVTMAVITSRGEDVKDQVCKYFKGKNHYHSTHLSTWLPCSTCSSHSMTHNCYFCCMEVPITSTVTSKSIFLQWEIPPPPPLQLSPRVKYYAVLLSSGQTMCVRRNETQEKHIFWGDLTPSTTYNLTVQVFSDDGKEGARSEMVQVMTAAQGPTLPPRDVRAEPQSAHEIKVSWDPPPDEGCHKNITHYAIHWSSRDLKDSYGIVSYNTSVLLSDLHNGTTYKIRVQAFINEVSGPMSQEVEARTMPHCPSRPPQDVKAVALLDSDIEISWKPPPKEKCHVENDLTYLVVWSLEKPRSFHTLFTKDTSVVFTGLLSGTVYRFKVQVYVGHSPGLVAQGIEARTTNKSVKERKHKEFEEVKTHTHEPSFIDQQTGIFLMIFLFFLGMTVGGLFVYCCIKNGNVPRQVHERDVVYDKIKDKVDIGEDQNVKGEDNHNIREEDELSFVGPLDDGVSRKSV